MKLTDIYNSIKEEMSDEEIIALLKKQLNPKDPIKVNKPVVKPNVIYTDKVSENEMELTPLQQYLYNYETEISGEGKAEKFLEDIKKLNNIKDVYDYYATERGWLVDKDLKQELKNLIMNLKKQNMNEEFKRMQELAFFN